jgi:hypothetical protein
MAAFSDASAIPAWARRYNVNCSHCHAPAVPRLNATGIRFRWAGFRMPEDIGQQVTVERVQNYISLRGRMRYNYAKTESQPASNSSFAFSDATLFYSGPFGKNYGAVFEFEREAEDNMELVAQLQSAWGTETSYGGLRFGQMHWLLREGLAGFDRPTGISTPLPVSNALTGGGIPFAFGNDQLGGEAYYMFGRNRISAEVLNGINAVGKGDEGDPDTKKDFVITDQYLLDEAGSGITAVGYYGTLVGADSLAPAATSHFWRLAVSANKIVNNFEVMGTVVYGKDSDLPVVGGGAFATPTVSGMGYWVYGGYTLRKGGADAEASAPLTLFGRYEYADPNSDVSNNARTRFVVGGVLPVSMPEYLRLALEYTLTTPQGGGLKQHGLSTELMLNF